MSVGEVIVVQRKGMHFSGKKSQNVHGIFDRKEREKNWLAREKEMKSESERERERDALLTSQKLSPVG